MKLKRNEKKTFRVMVVEDDPTLVSFWKRFLVGLDMEPADIFCDANTAERHLKGGHYSLLISDIVLPSMSGVELAKKAKQIDPKLEILLTTAHVGDLSRHDLKGCHFHLLHKPFTNLLELARLIQCMIHGKDVFREASEDTFSDNEDFPEVTEWHL